MSCLQTVLTTVINEYLFDSTQLQNNTVCLVWDDFDFDPVFTLSGQFVILRSSESVFVEAAIGKTFCERFVLLGNITIPFLHTFVKAVIKVNWRAWENSMVIVANNFSDDLLSHRIVKEIPDILFLKITDCCIFEAYTSKYISLYSEIPEELYLLDIFNGTDFQDGIYLFPNKKENFNGRIVRIGLFDYLPFSIFFKDSENGNAFINESGVIQKYFLDGTEGSMLTTYCKKYNCSIEIIRCAYGEWGTVFSNLSGEGVMGMVAENKADISFNALYTWDNIYPYCGMSRYMSRSGITFLIPGPKMVGSWLLPVHPFSKEVWIAVAVSFVLEMASIAFVQYHELFKTIPNRFSKSFSFGIMSTYQIYCSQGITDSLERTPKRIIFFFCFIIDLVVTSAYTGGLATILTLPTFSDIADTIPKMVQFGLNWGEVSDDWLISLKFSQDPTISKLMKLFRLYSFDEIKNLTQEAKVGVIFEQLSYGLISTPGYITKESAKLYTISLEEVYFQYCVSFVSKAWVHLKNYNKVIAMVQESGLPRIWEWKMGVKYMDDDIQNTLRFSRKIASAGGDEPVPLGMSNCSGMMVIWLFGIVVSIFVFLGEFIVTKKK